MRPPNKTTVIFNLFSEDEGRPGRGVPGQKSDCTTKALEKDLDPGIRIWVRWVLSVGTTCKNPTILRVSTLRNWGVVPFDFSPAPRSGTGSKLDLSSTLRA